MVSSEDKPSTRPSRELRGRRRSLLPPGKHIVAQEVGPPRAGDVGGFGSSTQQPRAAGFPGARKRSSPVLCSKLFCQRISPPQGFWPMAAEPRARRRRLGDPLKGALNRSRLENSPRVEGAAPGLRSPQTSAEGVVSEAGINTQIRGAARKWPGSGWAVFTR